MTCLGVKIQRSNFLKVIETNGGQNNLLNFRLRKIGTACSLMSFRVRNNVLFGKFEKLTKIGRY